MLPKKQQILKRDSGCFTKRKIDLHGFKYMHTLLFPQYQNQRTLSEVNADTK